MPKRSNKRKLNGSKMRRLHLTVHPQVFEQFEKIAGEVSYSECFEEMTKYIARKSSQKIEKTHFPTNYLVVEQPNT
jgi:hypothetical protein